MKLPHPLLLLTVGLVALILFSTLTAVSAANTIPSTRLDAAASSVSVNDLKPSTCAGLFLTNLITGTGTLTGTEGNDLLLASSSADVIDGLGGDDCIVGGGGSDTCNGGDGTDVFVACEVENP